jgi:membrane-associated phospholipid phosphatase
MTPTQRKLVVGLGVVGTSARGLVFGLVGILLIRAAVDFDPHKAGGLDGALRSLAPITDAGPWLLWAAAASLVVFGVYRAIRPAGGEPDVDIRYAVLRLVPAAVLLWGIFSRIGHLLGKDATPLDQSVTAAITSNRTGTWDDVTRWVSLCSATLTVVVITAVAFVMLRLTLRGWREAVQLVVAVAGQAAIFVCITAVVHRQRPNATHLDEAPPTSSFPSGHTGAAVALYGGLAVIAWLAAAPAAVRVLSTVIAVLLPPAVGLSRIYRGMHHLTDVLGALALSGIWLCVVTLVFVAATRQRAALDRAGPVLAR